MLRGVAATTAVLIALVVAPAVAAKTYKVTTRSDHAPGACTAGDCTLREAVIAANATLTTPDTIVLPSTKPYKLTIAGTDEGGAMTGDLDITNNRLRIVHPGKGKATIGGNALDRVFEVFAPATFEKLVIRNGTVGRAQRIRRRHRRLREGDAYRVDRDRATARASAAAGSISRRRAARLVAARARR